MKKLLALLTVVVCLLTLTFSLSACEDPPEKKIEGTYYLQSLYSQNGVFPDIGATNNRGPEYDCIVGYEMDFSKFYIEVKDGKFIEHGGITRVQTTQGQYFMVSPDYVREHSFELKKPEGNVGWYDIYLDGSDKAIYSFSPESKGTSAHILWEYSYGTTGMDRESRNYYLEGSPELSRY